MVLRYLCIAVLTVSCLLAGSCSSAPVRPKPPATAPNVLLVLIDTLRADKLGCYGNDLGLTPRIDGFARESFVFEYAFSHAPWTLPSVSSLLTSTYPVRHGAGGRYPEITDLASDVRTLAECFYDQGYRTGAIVNVLWLAPKFGMDRGFEDYDFLPPREGQRVQRLASEVTDRAVAWMSRAEEESDRPFFFMVHYFDPHLTYDPPESFRRKFASAADHEKDPKLFGTEGDMLKLRRGQVGARDLPIDRLERLYNGEVAYTDEQVGRLLDAMRSRGLDKSTIVVFTADHGEEFLDHGGFEHGHTNYDELIHVPLMLRYPQAVKPGGTRATVGHIDVGPTLLALAGFEKDPAFQGRSLEPLMFGEDRRDRMVLTQGNMWGPALESLRNGGYKLIIKRIGGVELYDVGADPHERKDLSAVARHQRKSVAMSEDLRLVLRAAKAEGDGGGLRVRFNEAEIDRLKALGYVSGDEGGEGENQEAATTRPESQSR